MSKFVCPNCNGLVGFPETVCSTGCGMIRHWEQREAEPHGVKAAMEAAAALVQVIGSLWGTDSYETAVAHGASSSMCQALIQPTLALLGYESEVPSRIIDAGFKPDFVFESDGCSVMVEVERGKTLDNNMDMLDMWKCHIHPRARHLILLVPIWYVKLKSTGQRTQTATFARVCRRMEPFFEVGNETNVRSLHVIGF
ncbi:MAG: hypothetical protein M3R13_09330 [Armatimonadota bacterium]|nr:hypothetical protein [Armatimonadota bacterium]